MADEEEGPYKVNAGEKRYEIRDSSGKIVLVCGDDGSAANYAALLNEAYRRGYKVGYRQAKGSTAQ